MSVLNVPRQSSSKTNAQQFVFTDKDFDSLRILVGEQTGISLSDHKRDMVYGRLSKRLRSLGLSRFSDYRRLLENDPSSEMEHFSNAITTNLTAFFRERHHFDYMTQELIPVLMDRYRTKRRLRIWSAGCSTGEEPYSLAITLRECIPNIDSMDIRILASDLDSNVIRAAATGIYSESRIEGLSREQQTRWFRKGSGSNQGNVQVCDDLKKIISFNQLNLIHKWPMRGHFDLIFCRNVVIYFDKSTKEILFDRFADSLQAESTLFMGHSETLSRLTDRFELVGKTIYRKIR
jgi:chemotaxis protein methyltransferase CheR